MQSKKEISHKVDVVGFGIDASIPGYSLRFFAKHETVTDTVKDLPKITGDSNGKGPQEERKRDEEACQVYERKA